MCVVCNTKWSLLSLMHFWGLTFVSIWLHFIINSMLISQAIAVGVNFIPEWWACYTNTHTNIHPNEARQACFCASNTVERRFLYCCNKHKQDKQKLIWFIVRFVFKILELARTLVFLPIRCYMHLCTYDFVLLSHFSTLSFLSGLKWYVSQTARKKMN